MFEKFLCSFLLLSISATAFGDNSTEPGECNPQDPDVINAFNFDECYNKRIPSKMNQRDLMLEGLHYQGLSEEVINVKRDLAACECIKKKLAVNEDLNSQFAPDNQSRRSQNKVTDGKPTLHNQDSAEQYGLQNFKDRAVAIIQSINDKQSALPFQASIISDGDGQLISAYSNNIEGTLKGSINLEALTSNRPQLKNQISEFLDSVDKPFKPDEKMFRNPEKRLAGQCVLPREFMAYNMIPDNEVFYSSLNKLKEYKKEDWDVDVLKKDLSDELKKEQFDGEKVKVLRARITFLNKNPMMKTLMSASMEEDLFPDKESPDYKKAKDLMGKSEEHKKRLFKIIKDTFNQTDCSDSCRESFVNAGKFDDYKKKLRTFFTEKDVGELTKLEAGFDVIRERKKLNDPKNFRRSNVFFTQAARADAVVRWKKTIDPNQCYSGNVVDSKPQDCLNTFKHYCSIVNRTWETMQDNNVPNFDDDVNSMGMDDFNTDIENNRGYANFNDKICKSPRKKNPKDPNEVGVNFDQFVANYCSSHSNIKECSSPDSSSNVQFFREAFDKEYPLEEKDLLAFSTFSKVSKVADVDKKVFKQLSKEKPRSGTKSDDEVNWDELNRTMASRDQQFVSTRKMGTSEESKPGFSAGLANVLDAVANGMGAKDSQNQNGQQGPVLAGNYSNVGSNAAATVPEKVEQMDDAQKQKLLSDWKKDYEDWKRKYGDEVKSNPTIASEDAANKARIAALEQALADQKKLTDEQRDLLNKAIAAQTVRNQEQQVVQNSAPERNSVSRRSNSGFSSSDDGNDDVNRAPASVAKTPSSNGGASTGSSLGGGSRSSRSSSSSSSDNSDVLREESKLISMRSGSNGAITIESVNPGNQSKANAIMVPLSDEQYRVLQSNPESINLGQLEQRIPKEQIEKLNASGQIILLLQNGSNPPFEVKVEKKNNKLVLSRMDKNGNPQEPVRRVFTLKALGDQMNSVKK